MTRKNPILTELVDGPDGGKIRREWYCKPPPDGVRFALVRSEWTDLHDEIPTQRIHEVKTLVICSGPATKTQPHCENQVVYPRRRFCSDKCARRARRAEKNVENPDFGLAALRMINAMSRRIGASDIDTFGMLWDLRKRVDEATVKAIDSLRERDFTYERMGQEIGVSRNAISQWHRRHLAKLAEAEAES